MKIIEVLVLGSQIAFLWWLFSKELKAFYIDDTRQKLFKIRDDFFDEARNKNISFDAPAYQMTRYTLNGMIRFTHELSLVFVMVILWSTRFKGFYDDANKYNEIC